MKFILNPNVSQPLSEWFFFPFHSIIFIGKIHASDFLMIFLVEFLRIYLLLNSFSHSNIINESPQITCASPLQYPSMQACARQRLDRQEHDGGRPGPSSQQREPSPQRHNLLTALQVRKKQKNTETRISTDSIVAWH